MVGRVVRLAADDSHHPINADTAHLPKAELPSQRALRLEGEPMSSASAAVADGLRMDVVGVLRGDEMIE